MKKERKKVSVMLAVLLTVLMALQPVGGSVTAWAENGDGASPAVVSPSVVSPTVASPAVASPVNAEKTEDAKKDRSDFDGTLSSGPDRTVAQALEDLTAEDVEAAKGDITLCLTGDTKDKKDIFLPRDKGIRHVTLTSEDGKDYRLGSTPVSFFANGIPFLMEHGEICNLYGGGENVALESTDITVTGGAFYGTLSAEKGLIIGGSLASKKGVDVSVSDSCNVTLDGIKNMKISNIYAGCFTDAGNVTADIGTTSLIIRDSCITTCVIIGGSYVWGAPTGNVSLDLDESNILLEGSQLDIGYMDFSFSIYGGHMGNDEVENLTMHCQSTDIRVIGTEINPYRSGGEIFGGSYDTDEDGSDDVSVDRTSIYLQDSSVNGVYGGGYYCEDCDAKTGEVDITVKDCKIKPAQAFDVPVILGGGIYLADTDYGETRELDCVNIGLIGEVHSPDDKPIHIWGEGYEEIEMGEGEDAAVRNQSPEESHLRLGAKAAGAIDRFDLDSQWTDVTVELPEGQERIIDEYDDYEDLKERIAEAHLFEDLGEESTEVIDRVDVADVPDPELPEDITISREEMQEKKEAAVQEAEQALKGTAGQTKTENLTDALDELDIEDADQVESLAAYLQMEFVGVELQAKQEDGQVRFMPQKLTLEITPYLKVTRVDGAADDPKKLDNSQLNGAPVTFDIGIPDSVTEKYADVLHYRSDGEDESYQVEVKAGEGGKYVELYAADFSKFDICFTDIKEGETPDPKPDPTPNPDPEPDPTPDPEPDPTPDPEPDPIPDPIPNPTPDPSHGYESSWEESRGDGRKNADIWIRDMEQRWRYRKADGSDAADQWCLLTYEDRSAWYYFGSDGYMKDGWILLGDAWYFLHDIPDGTRGSMYTGWHLIDGAWYYFEMAEGAEQGKLYVSRTTPDGYAVDENGARTVS